MKKLFFLFILFIITSCSVNRGVYWCGDHECANKKEKEAYFKKTMIVEVKDLKNKNHKNNTDIEKIMQSAKSKEKKLNKEEKDVAKQLELEEKRRIKEEKDVAKQLELEEKRRINEEKDVAKQLELEEKRRIKEEKKLSRKKIVKNQEKPLKKNVEFNAAIVNTESKIDKFNELVEKITRKNTFRSYPDINDTQY